MIHRTEVIIHSMDIEYKTLVYIFGYITKRALWPIFVSCARFIRRTDSSSAFRNKFERPLHLVGGTHEKAPMGFHTFVRAIVSRRASPPRMFEINSNMLSSLTEPRSVGGLSPK